MVQTTGGLTDFSEETLGKIRASCLEDVNVTGQRRRTGLDGRVLITDTKQYFFYKLNKIYSQNLTAASRFLAGAVPPVNQSR